jgi:hypothetical protein
MEASAKSVVAVGASETTLGSTSITNVGWFSSQGPTYDNRCDHATPLSLTMSHAPRFASESNLILCLLACRWNPSSPKILLVVPWHAVPPPKQVSNPSLAPISSQCVMSSLIGTSMASPSAAGSAALMRQYFIDPLFWATQCEPTDPFCRPFTPSGVLLKTMLLHSGAKMNQYFYGQGSSKNVPLTAGTPDFYQVGSY